MLRVCRQYVAPPTDAATVLVVDDEPEVADVYALRLGDEFDTEVAYGGEEALERIDDDIDVVLLDRRMPDLRGDDVLERIRDEGYDCRVIILTAVDPGLDIVDMPFDDYLCKPVERRDLIEAIDHQRRLREYDERLSEYLELKSKLSLLENGRATDTTLDTADIARLEQRASSLRAELDEVFEDVDDIESTFVDIGRYPS